MVPLSKTFGIYSRSRDFNGDGLDEVNGGNFGLGADGTVLWNHYFGANMDSVLVSEWDDNARAILSGGGQVVDAQGSPILSLGFDVVPHGQEIRCGKLLSDAPTNALVIRYNGHHPDLMIVDSDGQIRSRFRVAETPNNTGLEVIRWNATEHELIYSPAALYNGVGDKVVTFPELPPPSGGKWVGITASLRMSAEMPAKRLSSTIRIAMPSISTPPHLFNPTYLVGISTPSGSTTHG